MTVTTHKAPAKQSEPGTPRPRRPITIEFDRLPDEALVDKHVRRNVTGLGDSEAYERIKEGRFPAPVLLGSRCARWRVGALRSWLTDPVNWRAKEAA